MDNLPDDLTNHQGGKCNTAVVEGHQHETVAAPTSPVIPYMPIYTWDDGMILPPPSDSEVVNPLMDLNYNNNSNNFVEGLNKPDIRKFGSCNIDLPSASTEGYDGRNYENDAAQPRKNQLRNQNNNGPRAPKGKDDNKNNTSRNNQQRTYNNQRLESTRTNTTSASTTDVLGVTGASGSGQEGGPTNFYSNSQVYDQPQPSANVDGNQDPNNHNSLFKELGVKFPFTKSLLRQGYKVPTPIQKAGIPVLIEGKDLIGCAQTGTGKTYCYSIPMLQNVYFELLGKRKPGNLVGTGPRNIKILVLSPTRELAMQVADFFKRYAEGTGLRTLVIFGGVSQNTQTGELTKKNVDILVATPGRLLDLCQQGFVILSNVTNFVLDEADQMLDMGFIHDIRRVLEQLPPSSERQNAFFSATVPKEVVELSRSILRENFGEVSVNPDNPTAERVQQEVYNVARVDRLKLLLSLLKKLNVNKTLIFVRTKVGANRLAQMLTQHDIIADSIHGDKSQLQRVKALDNFKNNRT